MLRERLEAESGPHKLLRLRDLENLRPGQPPLRPAAGDPGAVRPEGARRRSRLAGRARLAIAVRPVGRGRRLAPALPGGPRRCAGLEGLARLGEGHRPSRRGPAGAGAPRRGGPGPQPSGSPPTPGSAPGGMIPGPSATVLERWLRVDPGATRALERMAELAQRAGEAESAAGFRRRKAEVDRAMERYRRLVWADDPIDKASDRLELAHAAEAAGYRAEARAVYTLVANPTPTTVRPGKPSPGSIRSPPSCRLAAAAHVAPRTEPGRRPARDTRGGRSPPSSSPRSPTTPRPSACASPTTTAHADPPAPRAVRRRRGDAGLRRRRLARRLLRPGRGLPASHPIARRPAIACSATGATAPSRTSPSPPGIAAMPRGYGHGVTTGDYDGDGDPDLFITRWRAYALYRNNGDGTFSDVTEAAGLGGPRGWPTSAAMADLDGDGDLDLYVVPLRGLGCREPPPVPRQGHRRLHHLQPARVRGRARPPVPQRRRPVRQRDRRGGDRRPRRPRAGRRRRRPRRGRAGRPVRRQRRVGQLPVPQPGRDAVRGGRAPRRGGEQRRGAATRPAWGSPPGTSTATAASTWP